MLRCRLTCSPQRRATLSSMMQLTVIQFRPTCCFTERGGKWMMDDNKSVKKLEGKLHVFMPATDPCSPDFPFFPEVTLSQTLRLLWPDLLVTHVSIFFWWHHVSFSPWGLWLSQSERDFQLLFKMSVFQRALIKDSSQGYEELKLPHSTKPIISLRTRLKILIQTDIMSARDHFPLVETPDCSQTPCSCARRFDNVLIRLQRNQFP